MKKLISLILILTFCLFTLTACSVPGADGKNGLSAFERALANGFSGTEDLWLSSLRGKDGKLGEAPEIKKGNWVIDGKDTGVSVAGDIITVETTKNAPLAGKTIVNFGDSITGKGTGEGTDISTYLAQLTGAKVYNCGFGGCRMSTYMPHEQWDAFSMYRIAEAVATGDFSYQEASFSFDDGYSAFPAYFRNHYNTLISIDFNEVDIITIAYGTNDYTASRGETYSDDPYSSGTFQGALRYSIEQIQKAYPHINIYLCTPIYRAWLKSGTAEVEIDSEERPNSKGGKLTDYVRYVKEIGEEYHLPVIDNYYELGINRQNHTNYFPVGDRTHPNPDGRYLIAKHMAEEFF